MKTAIAGYPRIGGRRELKFATEAYFAGKIRCEELEETGKQIRRENWKTLKDAGIDFIPSGDFSFYDLMLDTACMVGAIDSQYRYPGASDLDIRFAMARGRQEHECDLPALPLRKWFTTNYHFIVPHISDDTRFSLTGTGPLEAWKEARDLGIITRPTVIGPFTFLTLASFSGDRTLANSLSSLTAVYVSLLNLLHQEGVSVIQIEEPALALDLNEEAVRHFAQCYREILQSPSRPAIHLQVSFGDVRDAYDAISRLPFEAVGLDFIEGKKNIELLTQKPLLPGTALIAGVISGRNIWKADKGATEHLLEVIKRLCPEVIVGTSCSLLHVPVSLDGETRLDAKIRDKLSFAKEKLDELVVFASREYTAAHGTTSANITRETRQILPDTIETTRTPSRSDRRKIQDKRFCFPQLPATTIGSFPQTHELRMLRAQKRRHEITEEAYDKSIRQMIQECISFQEEIGLDVLVHGEFERTDMVEFFSDGLEGFVYTSAGWVQSYGTRCVKPPIIADDVRRKRSLTVETAVYAQSLSKKPVKGMLTGPVTILNWSFPREDISRADICFQIARALRDEVLDLEAHGISIIQIDEAALREKLPLRAEDWRSDYLDWAIPAFRLTHAQVRPETQIHTHMCYSEFSDIIGEIDAMDADVISFEASRSHLSILESLAASNFQTAVGPGVWDIHSPRIPTVEEFVSTISALPSFAGGIWINPDCGLKTRGNREARESLRNMMEAVKRVRQK